MAGTQIVVADGDDLAAIDTALSAARAETARPSLIPVRTHIGYGSPGKQDSFEAHGSPLGVDEVSLTKQNLGWLAEPSFLIPQPVLAHFREAVERGAYDEVAWDARMAAFAEPFPTRRRSLDNVCAASWLRPGTRTFQCSPRTQRAWRRAVASGKVMNAVAPLVPALFGGSADLDPSTFTALDGFGDFNPVADQALDTQCSSGGGWSYAGRNLHFGVREHAMGAIVNGLAAHGGFVPYDATFLIFSDYMRPPIRLPR